MKNIFSQIDVKTMITLNIVSIIVTAICEVFAIYMLITKGMQPETEHWKYIIFIIALVVISLLFLGSIASMILFVHMKNKKK